MSQLFPVACVILAGVSPALQVSKYFQVRDAKLHPQSFYRMPTFVPIVVKIQPKAVIELQ